MHTIIRRDNQQAKGGLQRGTGGSRTSIGQRESSRGWAKKISLPKIKKVDIISYVVEELADQLASVEAVDQTNQQQAFGTRQKDLVTEQQLKLFFSNNVLLLCVKVLSVSNKYPDKSAYLLTEKTRSAEWFSTHCALNRARVQTSVVFVTFIFFAFALGHVFRSCLQLDCPSVRHRDVVITGSDFKSDTIFGFLSPNYAGQDT